MKLLFVLAVFVVVVGGVRNFGSGQRPGLFISLVANGLSAKCISESGANQKDIEEIRSQLSPTRREGKCLLSCLEKMVGLQRPDGTPTLEGLASTVLQYLQQVNSTLYEKVLEIGFTCLPEVLSMNLQDPCDVAYEVASCGIREAAGNSVQKAFMAFILNI